METIEVSTFVKHRKDIIILRTITHLYINKCIDCFIPINQRNNCLANCMQVGSAANSAASVAAAAKEPRLHYLVHLRLGGRAENEFKCLAFDVPMCLRKRRNFPSFSLFAVIFSKSAWHPGSQGPTFVHPV